MQFKYVEEDPEHSILSTEDMENFVHQLIQNQNFTDYLRSFFNNNAEKDLTTEIDLNSPVSLESKEKKKTKIKSKRNHPALIGISNPAPLDSLEEDLYSMMMMTEVLSLVWLIGFISFVIQIVLASIIIHEQIQTEFFGTDMSIPIRVPPLTQVTQVLAVILAFITQNELLGGLQTIFSFPFNEKQKWGDVCCVDVRDRTLSMWFLRVKLPNTLKAIQGGMVLVASFIVIVQLTSTVDVLKDYSALFVVSSVDNFFFDFAIKGYFGKKVMLKAKNVKETEFEETDISNWLRSLGLFMLIVFLGSWTHILFRQKQGIYVKQAYPLCDHDSKFNNTKNVTFVDIIGDGKCQFPQGEGTNIIQCGWDGGDCDVINERYPDCTVNDFTKLGDGVCHNGTYNIRACGYDNGDCVEYNRLNSEKYRNCNDVQNIGWIGDGICNGGIYASNECELDGGDCSACPVENMNLIGDGNCDAGIYNTKECSFDGGDCLQSNGQKELKYANCNVRNIGWIGDGICNGIDYMSYSCGFDEGDCIYCLADFIGDGFCDEKNNIHECSYDGKDCDSTMISIGDKYNDVSKWLGGVLGHDGYVYGIPFNSNHILKIDTSLNATKSTSLVGSSLEKDETWAGSVVGDNGLIYGIPFGAKSILCYNTTSEDTVLIAERHPLLKSLVKFSGGVLANNSMIYLIPYGNSKVIKFDPSNSANPLTEIGEDLGDDGAKMVRGVLGSDGNIYGIPLNEKRVLKIDVTNDSTSFIGDEYPGLYKWNSAVLGRDGNIYACQLNENRILQINIVNQTTNLVGPDFGNGTNKWSDFVEGKDGFLYGIPLNSNELLRFDPINHIATLIPLEEELQGVGKWWGGVRADNGFIYGIPYNADQVLSISPLEFRS